MPVGVGRTGRVLCFCGAALGALGLAGWLFSAEIATTFIAGRPAMMPNTALSLLMAGLAAAVSRFTENERRTRTVLASIFALGVLTIGSATVVEYAVGWDLGIDQILIPIAGTSTYPGRMSPVTAVSLTLLATALLIPGWTTRFAQSAERLTLGAAFLSFVAMVDHLFGAGQTYEMRTARANGVALPTAIALLLIAVGMLLRNSGVGKMKLATSRGPGGILVRRLGIVAILGPPLLGIVAHRAILMAGFVDLPLTLAVLTTVGVPVALILIFVTAQKIDHVHDALEASREKARLLIEESADGFFVADPEGRYTDVNAAGCQMLGCSREDIIGKTIRDLIPPDEVGRLADVKAHLVAGGRHTAEWHLKKKDGTYLPVESSVKILADGRREAVIRDITRRKAAEEELRQAMERFRFLAEAGEILGASFDTEDTVRKLAALAVRSIATCCIIELSDGTGGLIRTRADASRGSGEGLMQVERAALNPGQPLGWLATQQREAVLVADLDEQWLRSHELDDSTVALIRDVRATSLMEVPIVAGDRVVGAMLLLADESGGSYSPADLEVAQDLGLRTGLAAENGRLYRAAQVATRAKDEMLSIVAHDLRSPLTAAEFGASVLALQVPEDRRAASQKTAETIHRSIRLATRLVEDLLDVASIEAGKLTLDLKEISPEVLVQNAVESCAPLAASAAVRLEAEVASGLPLVLADEDRMHQALGNLLNNAIKFTPAGGRVRVVAQRGGDEIRFAVMDTGPGISADHLPRVFDRFWQARTADRRGAGLGLAIAKGIVDAHRGHIWGESVPGEGSTFSFTVPMFGPESDLTRVVPDVALRDGLAARDLTPYDVRLPAAKKIPEPSR